MNIYYNNELTDDIISFITEEKNNCFNINQCKEGYLESIEEIERKVFP